MTCALDLARSSGEFIRAAYHAPKSVSSKSSSIDIVTETDQLCEKFLINGFLSHYPHAQFIAEESHPANSNGDYQFTNSLTFMIDPIDGTNNFVHSLPFTCVSIGICLDGELIGGVVHNPILRETFHAIKGEGAYLTTYTVRTDKNQHLDHEQLLTSTGFSPENLLSYKEKFVEFGTKKLKTSEIQKLENAAIITELGYDRSNEGVALMLGKLRSLTQLRAQTVRMFGSCAMNMCSVALGRADCYYEGFNAKNGPKAWDFAAATVICREAGAILLDPHTGGEFSIFGGRVFVSGTRALADQVIQQFQKLPELKIMIDLEKQQELAKQNAVSSAKL